MSWPNFKHFFVTPDQPALEQVVKFSNADTDFVGWVSPTYIDAIGKFNEANAYATDIIAVDDQSTAPWLCGSDDLGQENDSANLHLAAHTGRGRTLRGRFRVFGDDVAVAGYACALPLDHVSHRLRTRRKIFQADATHDTDTFLFEFASPVSAFVFTAISAIIPTNQFDHDNAVAIDIPEVDGNPTSRVVWGGEHLGHDGSSKNLRQGVFVGTASSIQVRLRSFGPDVAVAGYAIVLYYT